MARYLQEENVYWKSKMLIESMTSSEEKLSNDGKSGPIRAFWRNILKEIQADVFSDEVKLSYYIDSELGSEDIMSTKPQIPLLIQGILGVDLSSYETRLYIVEGGTKHLVSLDRRKSEKQMAMRMMSFPEDCIRLIQIIVGTQVEHKSWLADALVTSLSQYWPDGHINNAFAWTWWGLEWLVQSLEKQNPATKRLDYLVNDSSGNTPNLRNQFKDKIKAIIDSFLNSNISPIDENVTLEQMKSELKYAREQANDDLLELTYIEMLESHIPYLQSVVDSFIGDFSKYGGSKDTVTLLEEIFCNIKQICQDLIKPAYKARSTGFHAGDYGGLLSPPSFDRIDAIRQFNRFVKPLLAMILTKPPVEYDKERTEPREVTLVAYQQQELSEAHFEVCSDGVLEWKDWKDGDEVSEQVQVSGVRMNKDMNFSFNHVFLIPTKQSRSSVLSPLKAIDGLCTLRVGSVTARGHALPGFLEATELETVSLQRSRK